MGPNTVPSTPVGSTRETTWTHLLSIDSRIPLLNRWSILHVCRWIGIQPTRISQFRPRACQSRSKNTPNLTIHFQTKNPSIAIIILNLLLFASIVLPICKPIWISDPEILVYWTYQEWEDSVRLPVGDIPRPSLTSITRSHILSIPIPIQRQTCRIDHLFNNGIWESILRRWVQVVSLVGPTGVEETVFGPIPDAMQIKTCVRYTLT